MTTIIEKNMAYAHRNNASSSKALMDSCESFIGSELAYCAAIGGTYVDIDCSHAIHADAVIMWQADHEEAMTSTTEVSATIGEIFDHDYSGLHEWLIHVAGVAAITLQNGNRGVRITENDSNAPEGIALSDVSVMKLEW